jgi:mono/diheme cytochrome c family protein
MLAMFAVGATLMGTAAAATPAGIPPHEAAPTTARHTEIVRIDKWTIQQSSGAALYQQLCASCHGVDATGDGRAAGFLSVPAPPLDRLRDEGIPREHWTYVLRAPCEDAHHWGPHGDETMPCWRRIFRQALGNDAATTLVSQKLAGYLAAIQK